MRLKALFALLISLLLTALVAYFSYTGLFGLLEREVYNPGVRADLQNNLGDIIKSAETWHKTNRSEGATFFNSDAARKSVLPQQDSQDIFERARLFGQIQERDPYVLGIRIIAADGKRIHFSTFPGDILRAEDQRVVYRNYGADTDVAVDRLSGALETSGMLVLPETDALAYVLPYTDTFNIKGGFAVLYVRIAGLQAELAKQKLFPLGESVKASERGLVFGFPVALDTDGVLQKAVEEAWSGSASGDFITVGKTQDSDTYVLLSSRGESLYYGRMVPSSWFVFPSSLKLLLVGIFFCVVYIVFFLAFSIRRDPVLLVSQRIKRLEIELIKEYITEGLPLRERIQEEFERRRPEVKERIRQGLGKRSRKQSELVDSIIDKGWDEIIKVFVRLGGEGQAVSVDMSGIETMLKELLDRWSRQVPGAVVAGTARYAAPQTATPLVEVSDSHSTETAEELEELDEVEALEEAPAEALAEPVAYEVAEVAEAVLEADEAVAEAEPAAIAEVEALEEAPAEALAEPVAYEVAEVAEAVLEADEAVAEAEPAAIAEVEALEEAPVEALAEPVADEVAEVAEAVLEADEAVAEAEPAAIAEVGTLEETPAEALAEARLPETATAQVFEELEELESVEDEEAQTIEPSMLEDVSASFDVGVSPVIAREESAESVTTEAMSVEAMTASEIQHELLELAGDSSYVLFVNDDDEIPTIPEHLGLEILDELNQEYIEKFADAAVELEYEELESAEILQPAEPIQKEVVEEDDGLIIEEPIAEAEVLSGSGAPVSFENLEPSDFGATGSLVFEQLEITSPFDEFKSDEGNVLSDKDFRRKINQQSVEQEKVRHEIDDLLGEVEFDLFLDSFDFSALKNYNDEEGFLEINEAEIRSILEDSGIEIVESDNLEAVREIPMLSDKERELVEELQLAEIPDSGEPENAEPIEFMEQYIRHCLPGCSINDMVEGELEPVSEGFEDAEAGCDEADVLGNGGADETGDGVIIVQDGVFTLNRKALDPASGLDSSLKNLADDVLGKKTGKR